MSATDATPPDPLSLRTTATRLFRLDVVADLFEHGNDALREAWQPARRLVTVRDGTTGDRGEALMSYLRASVRQRQH